MTTPLRLLAVPLLTLLLCACDPHYNWREYRSQEAQYTVLLPAKPATHTRAVRLGELAVNMTMTAAEVDGVVFAVGSAELAEAAQAPAALLAMRTALARNIGAPLTGQATGQQDSPPMTVSVEATGVHNGAPTLLIGRFVARERRVYQVIVMGVERDLVRQEADTFLSSFRLQ
ncbi:hypothetical protein ASF61_12400 [Duganella sp. Leaf126]|uniref:hypothetical protein n=1 Tax=Duganella sp. Leaf126 TaxID=1736266 RepID=UPI0006F6B8ED|nr:hypothetical protein [Duganella sp. Leaf126]KQQ33835.1 hypothetical protein ASF61_12400 [Duganella sp. Leaf126]